MMLSQLRAGFLQLPLTTDAPEANRQLLLMKMNPLWRTKPQLILLPEFYLGGTAHLNRRRELAQTYEACRADLRALATEHSCAIFGSYLEYSHDRFYNTAELIGANGEMLGQYRKIHLFAHEHEDRIVSAGSHITVVNTPWGPTALLVCYDLRFPELLRAASHQGACVVLVCAQWPAARSDHWLTLLKARAIENQVCVIACNRIGTKGANTYNGHSVVISPWGNVDFVMKSRVSGHTVIDMAQIEAVRKSFPALKDALYHAHPHVPVTRQGHSK